MSADVLKKERGVGEGANLWWDGDEKMQREIHCSGAHTRRDAGGKLRREWQAGSAHANAGERQKTTAGEFKQSSSNKENKGVCDSCEHKPNVVSKRRREAFISKS